MRHRGLPPPRPGQLSRRVVGDALARVRSECAVLGIAAVVGTPYYPTAAREEIWNAVVAIDASGRVLAVCPKIGLTASERRFFAAGGTRPTFSLGAVTCGALLCREARNAGRLRPPLGGARITFWPGAVAWESDTGHPDNAVTPGIASACARALGSYVVQCNWSTSVNDPATTRMGGSLVLAPTGDLLHRCPLDTPGITCITLDPAAWETRPR